MNSFPFGGGDRTVTVPSGWTSQRHVYQDPECIVHVMTRTVGSSDPSSWNGSFTGGALDDRVSVVATYRGAAGLAVQGTSSAGEVTTMNTATVNNPDAVNWRCVAAAYDSASTNYAITSNEVVKRNSKNNSMNIEAAIWDSNGTIGTGNTSRTVSRQFVWSTAGSWIGILDAADATVTGTMAATLSKPTMTASGHSSYDGTLAATLPSMPTVSMSGISTPPEGTLDVLVLPVVSVSGATAAAGSLVVLAGPTVTLNGETRFFGVRVVTPERELEKRTITPRLGAVD